MTGHPRLTIVAVIAVLLTSLSLMSLLDSAQWLLTTTLLVGVVAATGYLARRLGSPRWLVPLIEIGVLALVIVARFTREVALWGVIPGEDARLLVRSLLEEAFDTMATAAPPAPTTPGLVFLLSVSIAGIAVVVDTLAVTLRSPALAGLPLLVLYAVPVAIAADGVSWPYFGLAAIGWLALLLADSRERVGGWGRRLGTRAFPGDPMDPAIGTPAEPMGAVGRRIGAVAIVVAVFIPAILPGLSDAFFGGGGGGPGGGGGSGRTVTTVNPFVSLGGELNRPDDTEVLRYTTDADQPDYLRLVTLPTFDGETWVPSRLRTSGSVVRDPLPPVTGVDDSAVSRIVTSSFTSTELTESTWLPAPAPLSFVGVNGASANDWVWDAETRVVWSPKSDSSGLTWTTTSLQVEPDAADLQDPGPLEPQFREENTALPEVPPIVTTTAKQVTEDAETPFEKAVALQQFFQSGDFIYDVTTPTVAEDPLTVFLESKRGFCQQFAGTYAVMARSLDLPTRVVVGFLPGEKVEDGSYSVSWHDAHAWPEVYFEGAGWTRFEPTPRGAGAGLSQPSWTLEEVTSPGGPSQPGPLRPDDSRPTRTGQDNLVRPGAQEALGGGLGEVAAASSAGAFHWLWLAVALIVVVVVLLPWALRNEQRRRRLRTARQAEPRPAALAAWAEISATCLDIDLTWPASRTPRQVAAEIIETARLEADPIPVRTAAASALRRAAVATERARYARTPDPVDGLADDVLSARAGLLSAASPRRRWRARLLAPSLTRRAGARTADALDWLDAVPRRVRAIRLGRRTTTPSGHRRTRERTPTPPR